MTNSATAKMRALSQRLIAEEAAAISAEPDVPPAFRVCEKLRRPLTTLVGSAGFRSLLTRALTLAKREAPGLSAVQLRENGSLEIVGENGSHLQTYDADAGVRLVAQLLGLLFTFVGEDIPMRLLQDLVPDASSKMIAGGRTNKA